MSEVKFVQIGDETLERSIYLQRLQSVLNDYPGALIFGTYFDRAKNGVSQEIWANGRQYTVGGGNSRVMIYEGALTPEAYVEEQHIIPRHGDYYIQISGLNPTQGQDVDSITGLPVERRTAYIYDSTIQDESENVIGGWVALDGNISADNVYFPNGIRHNQAWGTEPAVSTSKVDCVGYNLTNVMKHFLLSSGEVPAVEKHDNKATDPTVTVSSSDTISYHIYEDQAGTQEAISGTWFEVGQKLYIPAGTTLSYTGYDLTLTSSDASITEGGASITGMEYGYWTSAADAETGRQDLAVLSDSSVGDSVNADFVHDEEQTDGNCRFRLKTSNIEYTPVSGQPDDVSTNTPSTDVTIELPSTADRVFTVCEGDGGRIVFTGTNGNTWKATRSAYTIPTVGPVWVANNEYDKYRQESHSPEAVAAKTITSDARAGKAESFVVKGYYPVYSNIKQATWTPDTVEINNTTKNNYSWSLPTLWSSSGIDERPVYIEYPQSKSITLTVGGVPKTYTPTAVTKIVGGVGVAYYRIGISAAYSEGQTITFSLN